MLTSIHLIINDQAIKCVQHRQYLPSSVKIWLIRRLKQTLHHYPLVLRTIVGNKRSNDQMNEDNITQPCNITNPGNKKSNKKDPFYQTRIDESKRRRELISLSKSKCCLFKLTKFHCRNFIHKIDDKEGIYCG